MWVRSQDKTALMNATTFRMYYSGNSGYRIYCDQKCICEEYTNLGTYSTKEKALKVLDMIQKTIIQNETVYAHIFKETGVKTYNIFQMPADMEV